MGVFHTHRPIMQKADVFVFQQTYQPYQRILKKIKVKGKGNIKAQ